MFIGTGGRDPKKNDDEAIGMGNSASGITMSETREIAAIKSHLWCMKWTMVVNLLITFLAVSMMVYALVVGQGELKVYMDAADLTPAKVGEMSTNAQNIVSNVRSISANMVPVSEVTAKSVMNATGSQTNVSLAEAATAALIGVGHADWNSVLGNGSLVMGSVANLNFSVVTSLFEQAREPETQSVIKRQIDKALATFDFATRGVANVVTVFRDGVVAEAQAETEADAKTKRESSA